MDTNKKLIILLILSFVAVASLVKGFIGPSSKRAKVVYEASVVSDSDKSVVSLRAAKKSSYPSFSRNPFTLAPVAVSGDLTLEGILWDDKNPMAIVNGVIVKKGEKVGRYTVVNIQSDKVVVSDGPAERELSLT